MEISKSKIKYYSSLAQKKHRASSGLFMAEGSKCVCELLNHFELEALIALPTWIEANRKIWISAPEDKFFTANNRVMGQLSSLSTPPEVIAVMKMATTEIPSKTELASTLTLVLDGIQDPGNLGTIIRLADWYGIRHIIASPDTVDIYNPKTIQATMGGIGRVNFYYTPLADFLREMNGIPIYGTLLDGNNIYESELSANGIIIMGNEGKGISQPLRKYVTSALKIPSFPPASDTVESLNVAVATAVTVAEFRRRQLVNYGKS